METKFTFPFYFVLTAVLFVGTLLPLSILAQTKIVSYDFDAGDQGWTRQNNGQWGRGNSSFAGNNTNHWRISPFNNYNNNMDSWVESPLIDLSGEYVNLKFSVDVRYKTASNEECVRVFIWNICNEYFDGMNIEFSTDGTIWQRIGNSGEGINWYNNDVIPTLGTGWAGNNGLWQTASINLPAELVGQKSVKFRVRFASNNNGVDDGVAFDNVVITGEEPPKSPGGVFSNLSLWLKADKDVIQTAGSVSTWGDQSGNKNDATQSRVNDRPQYIPDALNGNPVVYFEQGPYMDGVAGFYTQQYFLVLDPNEIYNSSNAVGRIIGFEPGGFSHLAFGPSSTYSGTEIITHAVGYTNGYRAFQEDDVSNYGNPSLIVSQNNRQSNPTAQVIFNNGLEVNTKDRYTFRNLSNQGYRLGDVFYWTNTVGDAPFNGRIAEVISYSGTLTNAERRDVETYLAIKYGITLDLTSQDYSVNGNSIYGNKNYAKDIAGIGMNSKNQGLMQTASKSVNQGAIIKISNPKGLEDGDYLVWGNNGGPVEWVQTEVPAGNVDRFARTWHVRETGVIGNVDVSINLNQLGIDIENSTVNFFKAPAGSNIPGTFATATSYTNGVRSINSEGQTIITFHDIDFKDGEYFTIGGDIQTTSPGGVKDNLSMWFKADGGISLNGNSVKRWSDYSGNANDVYQGNNSLMPTFLKDQINYNPAISFDNDYLDGIDGFFTQDYFVVAKPNNVVNRNNALGALLGFESGVNSALILGPSTGSYSNEIINHYLNSGYQTVVNSNTAQFNPPLIINSKNNLAGNRQELFVDGILASTATTNNGAFQNISDTELRIGSSFNGSPYGGQIAEVISYSKRLNDIQRRDVETYLAIKYGITLNITSQSYTAGGRPIFNYTTHSNNIAGISRDLDNGYNQPRSKSSNTGAVIEMSSPSGMKNGSYLVWGKDAGSATTVLNRKNNPKLQLPSEYDERVAASYRIAVTGEPGTVSVKIYVGGLPEYARRSRTANFYSLLISQNDDFGSVNSVVAASQLTADTLVFHNVAFNNGDYFTLSVPPIPEIGEENTNTLWLRADKGLTLINGSQVSVWVDQSGKGNNASRSGTGPGLVAEAINGNNALTFNGRLIQGSAGFYTREYFVLASPDVTYSSSSNGSYLLGFESNTSGLAFGNVNAWSDEVLTHHYRTGHRTSHTGNRQFSYPTIINSRNNSGNAVQSLFSNGQLLSVSTASAFTNLNDKAYRLGNNFSSTGAFNGKIGEVLSFSTTQNAVEKRNIESYLALKYGITLNADGGNYTLGGTVVFNTTTFSGYAQNVAGIVSYAKYDFIQTTSKSINPASILTISNPGSLNNNDFLVVGDDNGALTSTTNAKPVEVGERMVRMWAVQTTNTPGTVTLTFDLTGLGYEKKTANDFSLILDNNNNFTNGISRLVTPTSWSGQVLSFTNVNLSGISYFGLGTSIDLTTDTDEDGIPDYFEVAYGTEPYNGNHPVSGGSPYTDSQSSTGINGDAISDALEKILLNNGATGPVTRYTDTDGDGIPDWIEVKRGTSPFNANSPTTNGASDSDNDGLPDALENLIVQLGGSSNPSITSDKDADGVPDFLEIINNTNPNNGNIPANSGGADADGDKVSNAMEAIILAGGATGTVDKESDTDDDGIPDYIEAITLTDPFNHGSPWVPNSLNIRNQNADFSVSGNSCEEINGYQWINVVDDNGKLVFSINPVGNDLGPTCYGIRILRGVASVRTNGTQYVMNRNWWITPATQPTGEKVYVRFYAQGSEMNDLWNKSVEVGIITPDVDETLFNRDYVRFTKIGNVNTLDPLVSGGDRKVLAPKLLPFKGNDRMFTVGVDGFSSFIPYASGTPTPLPIELLYFRGQVAQQKVNLNWATASEANNDFFLIERSIDGINFEPVRKLSGAGDSNKQLEYSTVDNSPFSGRSYYRLKQVDFDGKFSYSNVITVEVAGVESSLKVYPNPAREEINLVFEAGLEELTPTITLYDVSGRKCNVKIRQDEREKIVLDLSNINAGAYIIEVVYGKNKIVKLIIKE